MGQRVSHPLFVLISFVILFSGVHFLRAAGDGIPDNCENIDATYYQPTIFPRYELQNTRFVLVDWISGADVKVLESGLATNAFWIIGWSPDCRYLVAAVNASRDYYVWDTVDGRRIGLIPQARRIDWSPNSGVAVVQSDTGAYLWQFPANIQVLLTSQFNPITKRNFTALNWNLSAGQVVIRLENVGRVAFDITTGESIALPPLAERVNQDGYITIAGTLYHCNGYTGNAPYLFLRYNSASKQIVLQTGWSNHKETVLVLEQSDIPIWRQNNWSPDCRYISAALGDKHHTDTVVWDVVLRRRIAIFPDAHEIPHPFSWSPYSGLALIQTRRGGYLWNVATDTKTLLHEGVITRSGYSPQVTNFYDFSWDEKRGQLLAIGVNTPDGVTAYDAHTGQQIAFYSVPQPTGIVSFRLSPDGSRIDVYSQPYYYIYALGVFSKQESNEAIWDRDHGTPLLHFKPAYSYLVFSPDGHYLAAKTKGALLFWDLTRPNADSSPSYSRDYGTYNTYSFSFVDNTTFEVTVDPTADNKHKSFTRWDIVSGAFLGKVIPAAPASNWSAPRSTSPGVSGIYGQPGDGIPYNCQSGDERPNLLLRYEARNRRLLLVDWSSGKVLNTIEESLPQITNLGWSPQCHYFTAQVEGQGVVVWDAHTLTRLQVLPERISTPGSWKYFYSPFWVWSADDAYALLQTEDRTVMWRAADSTIIPLVRLIPLRYGTYWDYGRNQVIIGGSAFDLDSGVEKAFCNQFRNHNFVILNNGNIYVSFTANPEGFYDVGGVAVCNLNTLESVNLDTQPMIAASGQIAVSADGHYLVVARDMVRIWDLQNLSGYVDERGSVYGFDGPAARVVKVRFIDSSTLETTDIYGTIQNWDVMIGKLITDSN